MNKNLVENKVEVIKQDYTLYDKEVLHACFVTGATYQVPAQNLISKGVEVQFTVLKNTHKSVTIEVVEKYNGTINTSKAVKRLNAGGVGFWKTIQGVEYATVETFNANKLTRWVKGYINPFSCELATKELTVDGQTVSTAETVEKVEKVLDFTPVFYEIDEKMARLAREMNSFREYEENSTTEQYKARVKEVFSIAEKNQSEKSLYLAKIYAKKYAEYINNSNRVDSLYPSIMVCGAGNFNVRKKEKQNARRDNLMKDYEKLQNLLEKIKRPEGWGYAEIKRDTIITNEFDGVQFFKVVTNEDVNRLQLIDFEEIPTDEQKTILKKNGFKWSPRFQAWQRQLTENAINGVWRVVREFERLENEEIEELHATIQENKPVENTEPVQELEKPEPVAETPEPAQAQEVEPVEEIKLECVKSVVIDFKRNEEIQQVEPEPAQEVPEEQIKEDSEKIEPTPATEETTKEEHPETATKQEKHSKKTEPILKNVIDKSKLMRRAWDIRKSLAEEMKVKVSIISMSESLKIAWAEAKAGKVDYVSKIKNITTKFDKYIDNLDERTIKTIYVMLTQCKGNAWAKDDKARIYINNAWDLVEHEKLNVYSNNTWLNKTVRGDWANWKINGIEIDDVIKHRKQHLLLCAQLEQSRIDLDFYYDVLSNSFYFHSVGFDIENTIIENIKENVKSL